mmetsp:Transcript_37549/g.97118  ORF Transcript_37549/g.97118 Transcript_37549/m.97118 type:complete len:206 (-) Transcript_37549:315-932(-)
MQTVQRASGWICLARMSSSAMANATIAPVPMPTKPTWSARFTLSVSSNCEAIRRSSNHGSAHSSSLATQRLRPAPAWYATETSREATSGSHGAFSCSLLYVIPVTLIPGSPLTALTLRSKSVAAMPRASRQMAKRLKRFSGFSCAGNCMKSSAFFSVASGPCAPIGSGTTMRMHGASAGTSGAGSRSSGSQKSLYTLLSLLSCGL